MTVLEELKQLETSIVKRYRELQPALAEVEELRRVADRLGIDLDSAKPASPSPSGPRPRRAARSASRRRRAAAGDPSRRRRSQRREQVLKLVTERPGITVPELGAALGVDPTGLYRVVRQLEADGTISKRDKELYPTAA